jgi:hypothetical protein
MWISVFPVRGLPSGECLVMLSLRDDLMPFRRLRVKGDALGAVAHFHVTN